MKKQIIEIVTEDEFDVLESISLIHYSREKPLIIRLTDDDGSNIYIRYEFIHIPDLKGGHIELSNYNNDTLKILIKFNDSLVNFGYKAPIKIGSFRNRKLLINFRVSINAIDDSPVIINTCYLGEEVEK